ncbi:MAG: EthD family reductase [Chloroflexi bacterium]|nr:EthD family reductase [Chloroflexota bacterium]
MVKFTIIFRKPSKLEAFESQYNHFLALVEQMPLITRRQVNSVLGSPLGESPYYRVLEVYYDSYEHMQESLTSAAGQEAGSELRKFTLGTYQMMFADVFEEDGGSSPQRQ